VQVCSRETKKSGGLIVKDNEGDKKSARQDSRKCNVPSSRIPGRTVARHLFDCWPQVVRSIHAAQHLALFIDFDGTLVPLRRRPSDVKPLDLPLRRVLHCLGGHKCLRVYVISGRRLAELYKLVPVRGIHLLGLHGWEGREVPPLDEERRVLRGARQLLYERLSNTPKIRLEDKGLGLAVHYRGASLCAVRLARAIVREVLRPLGPQIHMVRGHKVWELLPRQINGKGAAVSALLCKLPQSTLAIFVGDDATDESAFRALPSGLTIRVGEHPRTTAHFFVRSPEEVKTFLQKLEAAILLEEWS
jgi:trehalose 6-phosphate phosphatase